MQITPDRLFDEAKHMALELRIKDRMLGELQAENERLRGEAHSHGHGDGEQPAPAPAEAAADGEDGADG